MSVPGRLPSLGDEAAGYRRVRLQEELPKGREAMVKTFARIIGLGQVQKVIFEIGQPIVYERMVPDDGTSLPDLETTLADDLFGAVRNNEVVDFKQRGQSGIFETLYLAFRFLASRRLVPKAFMSSNWGLLRQMVGADELEDLGQLYGVPTFSHEEVPDDVLILVATDTLEPDVVRLSLRIPLELEDSAPVRRAQKGKKT